MTTTTETSAGETITGPDLNPQTAGLPAQITTPKPVPVDFDEFELAVRRMLGVEDASAGEMALFHHVCQRSGLDPFSREIYMIGRNTQVTEWEDSPNGGERRKVSRWVTKYTIQVGINGFRRRAREIAHATGSSYQVAEPLWCGEDGNWSDVWIGTTPPTAAKVTVFRDGAAYTMVALYREFVQTNRDGSPNSMWSKMPANQLAKCAEAGALQRAFPEQLGGLIFDEAAQPSMIAASSAPSARAPERARGVAALAQRVAPPPAAAPAEPVEAEQQGRDSATSMSDATRRKWLNRMFMLLGEADCEDRDDQLIVLRTLSGAGDLEHRDGLGDEQLRTVVADLNDRSKAGTLAADITEILNRAALAEVDAEGGVQ